MEHACVLPNYLNSLRCKLLLQIVTASSNRSNFGNSQTTTETH